MKNTMVEQQKVCLVSCSVLRDELEMLVKQGKLDAELVFVSKYFHIDYELVEKNVRKILEHTLKHFPGKVVLIYGDLCLGQDNEMKKLADQYGIAKVDAVNCVDCQLGGKGRFNVADPEHNLLFLGSGMVEFFKYFKDKLQKAGVDKAAFTNFFSGIKGIILLDTCGNAEKIKGEIEKIGFGLPILETRRTGLENIRQLVLEAIDCEKTTTTLDTRK
jgi:hypothetical protein